MPVGRILRHGVALLLLLVVVWTAVGADGVFFPDEGAVLAQADQLATHDRWVAPYALAEVDPTGIHVPIASSTDVGDGYVAFDKHPLIPWAAAPLLDLGGAMAVAAPGVIATAVAAVLAAVLAERIRTGTAVVALWLTGVGSPLFVQSAIVTWHTVAAAAVVGMVVLATRALDGDDRASLLGPAVGIGLLAVVAILVRSEGVVAVGGLGLALMVVAVRSRSARPVVLGAAAGVAAIGALLGERYWTDEINEGGRSGLAGLGGRPGSGVGRDVLAGLQRSMFEPARTGFGGAGTTLLLGTALLVGAAICARVGGRARIVTVLAACGAAVVAVRALSSTDVIPSLVFAQPVSIALLFGLRRKDLEGTTATIAGLTAVATATAIALTQYADGGGLQWGGRFFAVVVPTVAAFAAVGAESLRPRVSVRPVAVAGAVVVAAIAVAGVRASVELRDRNATAVEAVANAADANDPPAVISLDLAFGRRAWRHVDVGLWVTVSPDASPEDALTVVDGLAAHGVEQVVVVMVGPVDLGPLDGELEIVEDLGAFAGPGRPPWSVVLAEMRPS